MTARPLTTIGLMSGTSLDGIDAALLVTDGVTVMERGPALTQPYPDDFRDRLRHLLGRRPDASSASIIDELTRRHADAVKAVLHAAKLTAAAVDVIGFHGQTVWHRPDLGETMQIGDGQDLADITGIAVVADFRSADVAAGGEGAPFAPLYHAALAAPLAKPVAVLNIGGVANVSWIGDAGADGAPTLLAFDTGPGNALIDDWVRHRAGRSFDAGGCLAAQGRVAGDRLAAWLRDPYFARPVPKSLDRDAFATLLKEVEPLTTTDGAATLAAFTVAAAAEAGVHFPAPPRRWLVTGGRHNPVLVGGLAALSGIAADPVEAVGWRGDFLEAEAFAFLAVRSVHGLPLSLPSTTGVPAPCAGGQTFRPAPMPTDEQAAGVL
jgi:anhydro-N-acetylmuramic acid kinase